MNGLNRADYIIGIDCAKDKDCSCMAGICSGCHNLIYMEHGIEKENCFRLDIFKECQKCGKVFNSVYIVDER